jgi:hypothetical protein
MTCPLVASCPASVALEDSYTTVDKDARKSDLHSLVLTLRRLETAGALSKELAEVVDYMDSDADLLSTRTQLLSFLPDISRQTFIRERRNPLQPIRPAKGTPTTSTTADSFSQILWLDTTATYKPETELWLQTWHDSSEQDGVSGFNDFTTTLSRFSETSDTFRTRGYKLTETRWRASAAMTAFYRNRAYISLSYEADAKDDYRHDGVILQLTVRVD